jgi:hypothetical protein
MNRFFFLLLLAFQAMPSTGVALPRRLVIALDGIAYRDMKALQSGVTFTNIWGGVLHRQAFSSFDEGYFPVSRMVSTFPSTSDVAWTDIFGNRPLPGYQRTYFSTAANSQISLNGVTTTLEHEKQMDWQVESGFIRSMGYIYSAHVFEYEMRKLVKNFWNTRSTNADYYAPRMTPSIWIATSFPCFACSTNSSRICAPVTKPKKDAICKLSFSRITDTITPVPASASRSGNFWKRADTGLRSPS